MPSAWPCLILSLHAMTPDLSSIIKVAVDAGRASSATVRSKLGASVVKTKASRGDLLTEVDGEVQNIIERHVARAFPTHAFLGEESVAAGSKASAAAIAASPRPAHDRGL
jgi:myo-inositol-1(or 4)-monophosphatase